MDAFVARYPKEAEFALALADVVVEQHPQKGDLVLNSQQTGYVDPADHTLPSLLRVLHVPSFETNHVFLGRLASPNVKHLLNR